MIRAAVRDDIPALVSLAKRHHEEHAFPFRFDAARLSVTFATAIERPDWLCLTGDGAVLLAVSFESPLGAGRLATEWLLRAANADDRRALIVRYEQWARDMGCASISLACTERPETFGRLFRRHGFAFAEATFSKRL